MTQSGLNIQVALLVVNIVTACLVAIISYFVKRMIDEFTKRIDKHDDLIFNLANQVQKLIGMSESWNGHERRG